MKKLIFCVALAFVATACQKVTEGGNKGAIKIEEGVQRYSDDEHRAILKPVLDTTKPGNNTAVNINGTDSTKVNVPATAVPASGTETTVNTMSAPVNNAKTDTK